MAPASTFPNELLEEIFRNLPVTTLTRFKCVCKSWRDLISSEDFINLHLKNYKTSSILVYSLSEGRLSLTPVYPPDTPLEARTIVDFTLPEYLNNIVVGYDHLRRITASCNGVICLWRMMNPYNIALWNPATKDIKMIPKSNLPRRPYKFVNCWVVFGYDDVRNDYKIIQALGDDQGVQFELYSLNTGLWKKLDIDRMPSFDDMLSTGKRIVCWLTKIGNELVLFDMSTEGFEIIQVPGSGRTSLRLIPYEGSIGVIKRYLDTNTEELLVLNDIYSESGGLRSWRKVRLPIYPAPWPPRTVAYWDDYLLYHDGETDSLSLFDHGCQGFSSPVGVSKHALVINATRYKESLVRLRREPEGLGFRA